MMAEENKSLCVYALNDKKIYPNMIDQDPSCSKVNRTSSNNKKNDEKTISLESRLQYHEKWSSKEKLQQTNKWNVDSKIV